jgi:uncharacterized protein YndB with AHSA1/START domain
MPATAKSGGERDPEEGVRMKPTPSGRVVQTERGSDLVLERVFRAAIEDLWASITEPERTARWIGPWAGRGAPGETVELTLSFEDGASPSQVLIEACQPPRRLLVTTDDAGGSWRLEAELIETGGVTTLVFTHHGIDEADAASVGPGWEYYLDLLVAAREGGPEPDFDDYYPAQSAHFEAAARAAGRQ